MGLLARSYVIAALFCCVVVATPVHAEPETEVEEEQPTNAGGAVRGAARFLANQGDVQLRAGNFERALQLFEMAETLFHAPTLVMVIAQTEKQLGRLRDARAHFKEVIDEKLPRGASPEFVQARKTARAELAKLDPRIPRLIIELEPGVDVEVRVDGGVIPSETVGKPLLLDPGDHHVVALSEGTTRSASVTLEEGDRETVSFDFKKEADERRARQRPALVGPLLTMGGGVVGLVFGAVTGARAISEADELRATCSQGNQQCDPAARGHEDTARNFATASTIGFVIGGLAIAGGTVWLSVVASEGDANDEADVAVSLGADGLRLGVRF
jgi:tetratricopeptide (TPR) repeat protein